MNPITITFEVKQGSRPVYPCRWSIDLEKTRLIQAIPIPKDCGFIIGGCEIKPTFLPGDNIRLNGEEYHITSFGLDERQDSVTFIYQLLKGRFVPPEWIQIGVINEEETAIHA